MRKTLACVALAIVASTSAVVHAQTHTGVKPVAPPRKIAPVPFGVHEKATFKVSFSGVGVGSGWSEVVAVDTVRGVPVYHFVLRIKGGIPFAHVDDTYESWLDVSNLTSLRFHTNIQEVNYKANRTFDMFAAESVWKSVNHRASMSDPKREQSGKLGSLEPLDDISFMYWARTIPLEVGKTYTFYRYFKSDGNPVIVKVLRRETVKVPAGSFATIVLQPIIKTKGLFAEGGSAELYFTDDARRMLVMMNTKMSIGSLGLQLQKFEPGTPLSAGSL